MKINDEKKSNEIRYWTHNTNTQTTQLLNVQKYLSRLPDINKTRSKQVPETCEMKEEGTNVSHRLAECLGPSKYENQTVDFLNETNIIRRHLNNSVSFLRTG